MITTKEADEIIDAIMERVEIRGMGDRDKFYPMLPISDRNDLIIIIKEIGSE